MNPQEKEAAFIREFNSLEDWMFQFDYLILRSGELPPLNDGEQNEQNLIRGCQSKVWLSVTTENGAVHFRGECWSLLIKGIVAVMVSFLEGQSVEAVLSYEPQFVRQTAIAGRLSAERSAGIDAVLSHIRIALRQHRTKRTCKAGRNEVK